MLPPAQKRRPMARNGVMAFKIDMDNAYD